MQTAAEPAAETQTGLHSQRGRYRFLDLYRGLFVFMMIEGHVVRELLEPGARLTGAFEFHELLHGLTGPGFFFGAGFTFAISAQRKWSAVTRLGPGFYRRAGRALLLVLLGYALHLPYFSLRKTIAETTPDQWNVMLAFGVLQCIGVTLLVLYILLVTVRHERPFTFLLLCLLPLIVYGGAYLADWSRDPALPRALQSALSLDTGSYYPILPFSGFVVAGVLIAWKFLLSGRRQREHEFMVRLCIAGAVIIVLALIAEWTILPSPNDETYWETGPNFFWVRLGLLFILLSLLWFVEEHLKKAIFPGWITVLGVESFFVYIVHIPIMYGWVINPGINLRTFFGSTLSFPVALGITAAMVPLMVVGADGWHRLKKREPVLTRVVLAAIAILLATAFLLNKH